MNEIKHLSVDERAALGKSGTRADTAVGSFGVVTGRRSAGSGGVARAAERDT